MMDNKRAVNKPLVGAVFCTLVFLAALLAYYSGPTAVDPRPQKAIDQTDGLPMFEDVTETEGENMPSIPVEGRPHRGEEQEPKVVTEMKDVTEESSVIIQRPDEPVESETEKEPEEDLTTVGESELDLTDDVCKTSRRKENIGIVGNHPRFQYVHVPKTGGTSIQVSMVTWVFHSEKKITIFKENGPGIRGSSFACPLGTLEASMLMGHRGYGYCREIEVSPRGLFTFATFRKGASRIISLFDYNLWREEPRSLRVFGTTPLNKLVKMYNSTPELEEGERILRFHGSQQVRFMCGYECMGPNAYLNATMTLPFMMKRAIANLKKVDVIGLTEQLNDVIIQLKFHLPFLKRRFGSWPDANEMSNRKKSLLDEQSMAIIEEWAKPDQQFYEIAKVLYQRKDAIARKCQNIK
jgi:hypothetical protein